jgi:apolipoprotein N-acyltransferase
MSSLYHIGQPLAYNGCAARADKKGGMLMPYPDVIWTALATIGGFFMLIGHEKELNRQNWWGIGIIFAGFLVQVFWELATTPTGPDIFGIVGVAIILFVGELVLIKPGWYRKWLTKRIQRKAVKATAPLPPTPN